LILTFAADDFPSFDGWTFQMRNRLTWRVVVLVTLLFAVVFAYPFKRTTVPQWRVRVLDEKGSPMRGIAIRETWQYYGLEPQAHVQEIPSDADGYIQFPARIIRASLLRSGIARCVTTLGVHASRGPSASLYALGDYKQVSETPYYSLNQPLVSEIILHRP